jgi:hypothetical protein
MSQVTAFVFDSRGRMVRDLARERFEPGAQSIGWDGMTGRGDRAPAGLYFVRVAVEGVDPEVKSMVLLR